MRKPSRFILLMLLLPVTAAAQPQVDSSPAEEKAAVAPSDSTGDTSAIPAGETSADSSASSPASSPADSPAEALPVGDVPEEDKSPGALQTDSPADSPTDSNVSAPAGPAPSASPTAPAETGEKPPLRPAGSAVGASGIAITQLASRAQAGEPVIPELVLALVEIGKSSSQFPKEVDDLNLDIPGFRKALGETLYSTAVEQFNTKSSADLLGLKKLAQKFLEPTDPNQRAIIRLFALVERCEHLSATQNILDLVDLRKSSATAAETKLLERYITSTIGDKVEELLGLGSPGKALRVLSETEPDLRTEKTADMARRTLVDISNQISQKRFDSNDWPFEVTKVKDLIEWLTAKDKSILPTLGEIYTWPLLMSVKNNDAVVAERMYKQVLELRPDPSPENDTLRLTIALSAKGRDAQRFAANRIAELAEQGKLTYSDKLKLLGSGYYGFLSSIFLTMAVVGILCALFFILFRPLMRQRRTEEAQSTRTRPKNLKGYQMPVEDEDEYSKLLSIFGLTDEASEDDIKKAFRLKVKELHPDAQGPHAADVMQTQDFIDLRRNYDRIIEIRKSWFGA